MRVLVTLCHPSSPINHFRGLRRIHFYHTHQALFELGKRRSFMRKNIILAAGVFMVFLCAQAVRAEMFSFSKSMGGTIADVRPNAITLTPNSPGQNQSPVNMEINDSTKLKDMQAVTELKKGDAVQVKYKDQDGKKIAVQVEKDLKAQSSENNSAAGAAGATGAAAGAESNSGATVTTTTTDYSTQPNAAPNTEGSKNTAEDQMLKTNQGTNQGAANKETPGMDQSGSESSSQFQQGSQQDSGASYQGSTIDSTQTGVKAADPTAQPDQNAR
jgi:hypothetical protein